MPAAHYDDESLLTVQQVADWLKVEPRYVYGLASSGALLRVYVGRYVRIPAASVRAYIKANTVEAVSRHRSGVLVVLVLVLVGVCGGRADGQQQGPPSPVRHGPPSSLGPLAGPLSGA